MKIVLQLSSQCWPNPLYVRPGWPIRVFLQRGITESGRYRLDPWDYDYSIETGELQIKLTLFMGDLISIEPQNSYPMSFCFPWAAI